MKYMYLVFFVVVLFRACQPLVSMHFRSVDENLCSTK